MINLSQIYLIVIIIDVRVIINYAYANMITIIIQVYVNVS